MTNKTYGFKWGPMDRGDQYILNESSYACLFNPNNPTSLYPSDVWLDIGAHIGTFAIRASQFVRHVVAVEPAPVNLDRLKTNIALNEIKNITVLGVAALGSETRKVNLGLGRTFNYTNRIGFIRGRENVTVQGINVNTIIDEYEVNKIKMDCEGSEFDILLNINYLTIDEIILEWHFTLIPDSDWTKLRAVLQLLKDHGFQILRAPANLAQPTKRWTAIIWARKE